jgi:TonB family protein
MSSVCLLRHPAVAYLFLVRRMNTRFILTVAVAAVVLLALRAFAGPQVSAEQARQWAIATPKPVYPEAARQHGISGSGFFKLYVRAKTGRLKSVKIFRSTGNRALDAAAVWALLQWRFKPGVLPTMRQLYPPTKEPNADEDACVVVPVSFTLSRAGAHVH